METVSLASDADVVLQELCVGLEHPSLRRRLAMLEALVAWMRPAAVSEAEALSKPQTRAVARLLLSALCNPQYLERSWIKGLANAVALASGSVRCPTFTPICAVNLSGECPMFANT